MIYFAKVQKARIAIQLSLQSFGRIELEVPDELQEQLKSIRKLEKSYEKNIKEFLVKNPTKVSEWMLNIR